MPGSCFRIPTSLTGTLLWKSWFRTVLTRDIVDLGLPIHHGNHPLDYLDISTGVRLAFSVSVSQCWQPESIKVFVWGLSCVAGYCSDSEGCSGIASVSRGNWYEYDIMQWSPPLFQGRMLVLMSCQGYGCLGYRSTYRAKESIEILSRKRVYIYSQYFI